MLHGLRGLLLRPHGQLLRNLRACRLIGLPLPKQISGTIKYNGLDLNEFQPRRTAGLVQQRDNHIAGGWAGAHSARWRPRQRAAPRVVFHQP